ncbi:MAG TPA: CorA family divalent cation transporter [Sulfurovum sp.]
MKKDINDILDPFHKEDLANPVHPSVYIDDENYKFLILRLPSINDRNDIVMVSRGFVFFEEDIYQYDKKLQKLVKLGNNWHAFYLYLDEIIDDALGLSSRMNDEVIDMEERLYRQKIPNDLLSSWFSHRSYLIRMNRVMRRTIDIYEKFYTKNKQSFEAFIHNFDDLSEHLLRSQRYIEHSIEKLNSIYSFYSAINNDKMNRSVYLLTIISAVFLPLNLAVGFFGMNTGSLPFTSDGGTLKVVMLLSSISIVLVLFLLYRKQK